MRRYALLTPLLLAACTPPAAPQQSAPLTTSRNTTALLALLASPNTPDASRQAADQRYIAAAAKNDPARLAILEQLLFAPGHSDAMRIYALDQLAAADAARCASALMLYLPRMEGDVLAHACQLAKSLGDPRLLDALTRSLARDAAVDRPELAPIHALSGQPPAEALLAELSASPNTSTQIAALTCLEKLVPAADLQPRVAHLASDTPFVADLQWWTNAFGTLPVGENECRWIGVLRRPANAPLVERALARHKLLSKESDYQPAPRFIAALAYIDEPSLALSREQLIAEMRSALDPLPHDHRPPQYPGASDDLPDTLAANVSKLTRGDLLALRLLVRALPSVLPALYQQGLDDLSDATTEHGGLLSLENINDPHLTATLYPPAVATNDVTYLTPEALIRDTPLGLAQYHFHFQQIHNEERAGPGPGDLAYIRNAACNAVVITSIDTRKINIDFYTPAGALIDLGTYTLK